MSDVAAQILAAIYDTKKKDYDPQEPIWRYMSFGKFADMVHNNRLFFSRPQSFHDRDKFEGDFGSISQPEKERIARAGYKELPYDQYLGAIERTESAIRNAINTEFYVNCWHVNEHENALMWDAYCVTSESICIQSRPNLLVPRLPDQTLSGKVIYILPNDRSQDDFWIRNAEARLFCKRSEFQDESEFRFIVRDFGGHQAAQTQSIIFARKEVGEARKNGFVEKSLMATDGGAYIYFDDLSFIEKIILHRKSGSYLFDLVKGMYEHYEENGRHFGRDIDIVRSGI